jgi:hypothetical protein
MIAKKKEAAAKKKKWRPVLWYPDTWSNSALGVIVETPSTLRTWCSAKRRRKL